MNSICKNGLQSPSHSNCADHYGCIFENNHLVTLLVDPSDGSITDANRAACEFYGYSLRTLRSLHITDLNADDAIQSDSFVKKAMQEGDGSVNLFFLEKHRLADGTLVDVEIHTGLMTMRGKSNIYSVIHDVGKRVTAEQRLKDSEERYRNIVELSPEAMVVHSSGTILFVNRQMELLLGLPKDELLHHQLEQFLMPAQRRTAADNPFGMGKHEANFRRELRFVRRDGQLFDLELSGAPISYQDSEAVQLVLRDITESKKEIVRATLLQEHRQRVEFPLPERALMEKLYVPATTLSGDFYFFSKLDDHRAVGIIGDVTGKGISAALSISAVRVLFHESVLSSHEPTQILSDLNQKLILHLDEEYIAACCFIFDFSSNTMRAAGAGINEFIYAPRNQNGTRQVVRGAPLGMFAESAFDEMLISFKAGDRICFYSDGLEFILDEELKCDYGQLERKIAGNPLPDDCTWLCFTIKER